jgi:hypothetical protein
MFHDYQLFFRAMPILCLAPIGCFFIENTPLRKEAKWRFLVTVFLMVVHKYESFIGKEWEFSPILQTRSPEDIFVTFCGCFFIGLFCIGGVLYGQERRLFFIWSMQLLAECHHFKKEVNYPGRGSALVLVLFNLFGFAPAFLFFPEWIFLASLQLYLLLSSYGKV